VSIKSRSYYVNLLPFIFTTVLSGNGKWTMDHKTFMHGHHLWTHGTTKKEKMAIGTAGDRQHRWKIMIRGFAMIAHSFVVKNHSGP
jgi:hypothetical protein